MPQADERALRDRQVMLLVIACLSALYALTFSGQYRSIDEYAMYARTESWALGLGPETPQLAFSARHHPVGALEPGQPLLAVPFYLLSKAMPGASTTIAVMLLSVVATAATGGVLYRLARELGCGERSAALTALACSVGTTAWPYARSFFREPLLGLLWSVAALACLRWQRTGAWTHALACGIAAAAGVAVKIASVTALPVFALALLWDPGSRRLRIGMITAPLTGHLLDADTNRELMATAELLIYSDGKFPSASDFELTGLQPTFVSVGSEQPTNLSILAFSVERNPDRAGELQAFATIANAGDRAYATAADYAQQGRLVMVGARYQASR